MSSMQWFRSIHGAPTDPKWRMIAMRAKAPTGAVVSVAWALFDHASQHEDRGSVAGFDCEMVACFFDYEVEIVERIVAAMRDKGIIDGDRLRTWEKHQPKREREGDLSTERTRRHKEKKRQETQETAVSGQGTPGNATERQGTPREEESREDIDCGGGDAGAPARDAEPDEPEPKNRFDDPEASAVVADFFAERSAVWPDAMPPANGLTQRAIARQFLDAGASRDLIREVVSSSVNHRLKSGLSPPTSLKYFTTAVSDAIARQRQASQHLEIPEIANVQEPRRHAADRRGPSRGEVLAYAAGRL